MPTENQAMCDVTIKTSNPIRKEEKTDCKNSLLGPFDTNTLVQVAMASRSSQGISDGLGVLKMMPLKTNVWIRSSASADTSI